MMFDDCMHNRMTEVTPSEVKLSDGIHISMELFLRVTGLNDKRNKRQDVEKFARTEGHWSPDGYIYYENALILAKRFRERGKFWMYGSGYARRILDHLNHLII